MRHSLWHISFVFRTELPSDTKEYWVKDFLGKAVELVAGKLHILDGFNRPIMLEFDLDIPPSWTLNSALAAHAGLHVTGASSHVRYRQASIDAMAEVVQLEMGIDGDWRGKSCRLFSVF
ncbi:hypothetical protein HHK36_005398 [Tetracentron sinense]|uniref:Uncharacterized protein n=1 Tax=Tetracentron sinense TaxID=13715 RepID=A0A835DQN9_TETSI|nr:hypothetical protein HHK36_005398 [Tetracentron sinense]